MGVGERVYWAAMTRQGRGNVEMDDQNKHTAIYRHQPEVQFFGAQITQEPTLFKMQTKRSDEYGTPLEYSAPGQIAVNLNRENNIFSNLNCNGDMSNTHTLPLASEQHEQER